MASIDVEGAQQALASALQSGPWGVPAMMGISAFLVIAIVQYSPEHGISVGYGSSVALISLLLRKTFGVSPTSSSLENALTLAALFHGTRLTLFLYMREVSGWKPKSNLREISRLGRIPFSLLLSLLFGLMTSPLLYVLRNPPTDLDSWQFNLVIFGTVLAWLGSVVQAAADAHKFVVKTFQDGEYTRFAGPTRGLFRLCRHPNYLGEIMVWVGLWAAGLGCISDSYPGYVYSTFGLYGIVRIMVGANVRLEERQNKKYGGQRLYQKWRIQVPAPLVPFVRY